jgi:hypothetical protein
VVTRGIGPAMNEFNRRDADDSGNGAAAK